MQPSSTSIQHFLSAVDKLAAHQAEITRLKGERFNLFSILGMESAENKTHSAFFGEMLNPKGSHDFGAFFLEAFLTTIKYKGPLDYETAHVILEKYIGPRDDKAKTGGRIDIYIEDKVGHSISIENKIYASDQFAQIERYVNHKKAHPAQDNTVYYLTLEGGDASEESRGALADKQDYHCISYSQTIIAWLRNCLKEAADRPILRESIKQYIILIQKLTGQLSDKKMENDICDLIDKNYAASKLIANHIGEAELRKAKVFLTAVVEKIKEKLPATKDWLVSLDEDLWNSYKGIYVSHKDWNGICIKLQGETKIVSGRSALGILATVWDYKRETVLEKLGPMLATREDYGQNDWWPFHKWVDIFQQQESRDRLFVADGWDEWVAKVADMVVELAVPCEEALAGIARIAKE